MRPIIYTVLAAAGVVAAWSAYGQQAAHRIDPSGQEVFVAQAGAAQVQTTLDTPTAPAPLPGAPGPAMAAAEDAEVDLTALRYFARQGDTVRMQAELQRLRLLHPGWEPPLDLLADDGAPDDRSARIWHLFTAGDYAGVRAAIAAEQASDPSFRPDPALVSALDQAEAGLRLRTASDAKQYETVISVAANFPGLLTCEAVDNLWRLAEAFSATGNARRSSDAYAYILANCDDPAERLATVQKASAELDPPELSALLAVGRTGPNGDDEFLPFKLDLARTAVAASLDDGAAVSADSADIALLESAAEADGAAQDLRLLGWWELSRGRAEAAKARFEAAVRTDPSVDSATGLATSLLQLGDPAGAESALVDFVAVDGDTSALYLDAASALLALQPRVELEAKVLTRIVGAVMQARNARAAQELGWYAQEFRQSQTASEWFSLALRWQPDLEAAAFGLMVASAALGDTSTVESIRRQWGDRSERIASFGSTDALSTAPVPFPRPADRPTVALVHRSEPSPAPTYSGGTQSPPRASVCTEFVPAGALSSGAALGHGWCLMGLNRPAQAVDHFTRALQSASEKTRSDAAYGLSLAYIRMGLGNEAAVAAAAAPISSERAVELEVSILSEKAVSAYRVGDYRRALDALDARARYAPERNDLLTLRAWSYYHIKRYRDAQRIFQAVASTGYGDAATGLQAATDALRVAGQ